MGDAPGWPCRLRGRSIPTRGGAGPLSGRGVPSASQDRTTPMVRERGRGACVWEPGGAVLCSSRSGALGVLALDGKLREIPDGSLALRELRTWRR